MEPNKRKLSKWAMVGITLFVLLICGLGVAWPQNEDGKLLGLVTVRGKQLPDISMAPERLPIELPFIGELPNTLTATWLTMLLLVLVGLAYRRGVQKAEQTGESSRFVAAVDGIIETVFKFVESVVGTEKARVFFPLFATFFFFILVNNWMGLLPGFGTVGIKVEHHGEPVLVPFFRSANADLSTTVALGLITMVAVQVFGFRFQGRHYLRKYINFTAPAHIKGALRPVLMVANGFVGILELVSEVIKIFSFAFRLFGNIFAGEVLLMVVTFLAAFVAVLPFMGLELFVGLIQALVFSMLSLIFYSMATEGHGGEEHHEEHHTA